MFELKRRILTVGHIDQRDANLDPCGLSVVMVVETVLVFVDVVATGRVALLELAPSPCPTLIGHAVFLFDLVGDVDLIENGERAHEIPPLTERKIMFTYNRIIFEPSA